MGLTSQAEALASLPEIVDFAHCPSLMPTLEAVRSDASAARAAARAAASDAAWAAAWAAARDAAWDSARDALASTVLALQQSAGELLDRMIAVQAADAHEAAPDPAR